MMRLAIGAVAVWLAIVALPRRTFADWCPAPTGDYRGDAEAGLCADLESMRQDHADAEVRHKHDKARQRR